MNDLLIKKIHQSGMQGIFIENGGPCVVSELIKVAGSSNTIFHSEVPYNKAFSQSRFKIDSSVRSVSIKAVKNVITSLYIYDIVSSYSNINFIFTSSFQLGDIDNEICTHGYIGFRKIVRDNKDSNDFKYQTKYYHLSINERLNRKEYIDLLVQESIKIIYDEIFDLKIKSINSSIVDGIWFDDLNQPTTNLTPKFSEIFECINSNKRHQFCYIENLAVDRLELLLRKAKNKKLILYKGSFDPLHIGHKAIINKTKELFPNSVGCLSISTDTYDKGIINDYNNLISRIQKINEENYGVLIYNKPLFSDMIRGLSLKSNEINLEDCIFPMGEDTWNRFMSSYLSNKNIEDLKSTFIIFSRNSNGENLENLPSNVIAVRDFNYPISSSEIRNNSLIH